MLFDLRGRGRRRTVRVIYTGLALLMGVGLVGFGIGGGFGGGGLFTAASHNEGAGGSSYASEITKYKKITAEQPSNVSAWESLLKAQLHEAGNEPYETSAGVVTSQGKALYGQVAKTWTGYIALNPAKVSPELAKEMLRIYDEEGLNEPTQAVRILQLVVADEPSNASYYAQLAEYAYKAKNDRIGDLASEKAVSLAPASEKTTLKNDLAEVKANPTGASKETLTTKTNGKTYVVKPSGNGSYTGTEAATTPAPAGSSSTTTTKK